MLTIEEVKETMNRDLYAAETTGAVIESMDEEGNVTVRLDLHDGHYNSARRVMGGAIFTIADFAIAATAYAKGFFTTAINCEMEFLSAGKGSCLRAKAKIDKAGRNIIFGSADVFDDTGKMIARMRVQSFRLQTEGMV